MRPPTEFTYKDLRSYTNKFKKKIAKGGFGFIYRGRIPQKNKYNLPAHDIVVKVMLGNVSKKQGLSILTSFQTEKRVLSNIDHPNVVKFIGYCTTGSGDEEKIYLVMEYIKGKTLTEVFRDFEWGDVLNVLKKLAEIVQYLHNEVKIIHCDLKPDNIMIEEKTKELKSLDFGLSSNKEEQQFGSTFGYVDAHRLYWRNWVRDYGDDAFAFGTIILNLVRKDLVLDHVTDNNLTILHVSELVTRCVARDIEVVHESLFETGCTKDDAGKIIGLALDLTAMYVLLEEEAKDMEHRFIREKQIAYAIDVLNTFEVKEVKKVKKSKTTLKEKFMKFIGR